MKFISPEMEGVFYGPADVLTSSYEEPIIPVDCPSELPMD